MNDIKTISFSGEEIIVNPHSGDFDICLKRGQVKNFYFIQAYDKGEEISINFKITLEEDSHLNLVIMTLTGKKIINNYSASLVGNHSECNLSGLYLVDGGQLVENNILLNHEVAECNSNQLFKGIIDGDGVSKFYGLIKVEPDSQKIEAYQANHNLLMSDSAKAFTKPQLEIYADDVKCSHGATIGKLNEDEAFYLRSRGISETESTTLLQIAFVSEVIDKISSPDLREKCRELVEQGCRLPIIKSSR